MKTYLCTSEPAFFFSLSCFHLCVRASSLNSSSAPCWPCVQVVEAEKSRACTHSTLSFIVALGWKSSLQQLDFDPVTDAYQSWLHQHPPPAFSRLSPLHVPAGSAQSDHKVALSHRKRALLQTLFVQIIFILH